MEVSRQRCVSRCCFGTKAAHAAPDPVPKCGAEQLPGDGCARERTATCWRENEMCADDISVR